MQYIGNGLGKLGYAGLIAAALGISGCGKKAPEPAAYERVVYDEVIPQHGATATRSEKGDLVYRVVVRGKDGKVKNYEFVDGDRKQVQEVANDIDSGDEIKVVQPTGKKGKKTEAPPGLNDVTIRDNYVTGHVAGKRVQYFRNSAGVPTMGELRVDLVDLNGNLVELKYEGHPMTIANAYKLLGPAPVIDDTTKGGTPGRLVKLPRASSDLASALYDP